jgi:hypothetical protein
METLGHMDTEWKLEEAMNQLLTGVQKRGAQRRKRANLNPTLPKDWRGEATRRIRQDLHI